MSLRRSRAALLACSAFFVSTLWVHAQTATAPSTQTTTQEGEPAVLEKLNVKGARLGVSDTPLASTVTQTEIEDKQVQSISDLGRSLEPGVYFNRTNGSVNIRGLEGSRVLTTIDGIPLPYLSDATRSASGGVDTFDFTTLSAVDVVRGSDSSRAGSGALGGVLALRTLEPEDLIKDGRDWGGIAKFIYDGSDSSFTPSAAIAKRFGQTSVLFQGAYRNGSETRNEGTVGGYGAFRTEPNPSDFDQHDLLFKIRHLADGGHMFGLTAERFARDRTTDSLINQSLTGNYRPGDYTTIEDSERKRLSLDYAFTSESDDSLFDAAAASLYWQDVSRATGYNGYRSTSVVGPITRYNTYSEKTYGLIGSVEKTIDTGNLSHRFTFGFDLAHSTVNQYSRGTDNCPAPLANGSYPAGFTACANLHSNQADTPRVESNKIGLYLDDAIALGQSGFVLTPGVRFDWYERNPKTTAAYEANSNNPALPGDTSDTAISPKLRLSYTPTNAVELYGQWAMGFRAPTAGELYSTFGGPGTYLRIGNPNLEAETSNGFDVGANLGDENFGGRVSVFHNRYHDFIDTYSLTEAQANALGYSLSNYRQGGISSYYNIRRARIYGTEIAAHKSFDNGIRLRGSLSYAKGENLDTDEFLQSVAPMKGVLGVDYNQEQWGVSLDWIAVKASRGQTTYSAQPSATSPGTKSYFKTPGYGLVDLTGWYEPEQFKGLKINAGVYNVFDKAYYDYVNVRGGGGQADQFYTEPGRSFKVSLTQRF
ncbi:TonB-dependent hemoglobin/transferrin/lactoferrin family receptor [Rhizobium sp. CFBP 8762]|uniref:TonB-dependent hemoglobin/transferrin/lactoferrin family receptor n=1 Tax=Rhizobium sp. CFBP 8762 TaxID=2775279 RepID=UPI00177B24A4|nr:TonB-dependent hemoglobin/transferrin/lactoferrin family receptor [Rhizobium sp. CFBP 8762]MBD8556510.1 TonB-dependent hemoglobin/transferrin/lactoferrin family receptor [Rhizobium sp. CFBP 8762]